MVLKVQGSKDKNLVRSFVKFVRRKVKILTSKALPKIPKEMLNMATYLGKATTLIS